MKKITMAEFIKKVAKSPARKALVPMEMTTGWPALTIRKGRICVTIPFFGLQRVPQNGKVGIYPISYAVTALWPSGVIIDFKDLKFTKEYKDVDFSKPIGVFKHEALAALDKDDYQDQRERLLELYDSLIDCIVAKEPFREQAEMQMLMRRFIEPSLYPMYKSLADKFYDAYCGLDIK